MPFRQFILCRIRKNRKEGKFLLQTVLCSCAVLPLSSGYGGDPVLIFYRVFSHDVTAAILVSQNNGTAAMLVSQTNPLGVEFLSYANAFFCSNKFT